MLTKKLTIPAAVGGVLIGYLLFLGGGWTAIVLMALFFIMGSIATSWNHLYKESIQAAEKDQGQRKLSQVLANAGVAALVACYDIFNEGDHKYVILLIAASFSSATADTLSSELGTVYGKRFFNILTFKKDKRGLDGVISAEGTFIGVLGSIWIALCFCLFEGWDIHKFLIIVIAGTIGNLSDSILGAAFERKGWIKNDMVNFLNTLIAAAVALLVLRL